MWILESLSEIPFRKSIVVLCCTLGAGFLLLARFFSVNALFQPILYSLLALDLFLLWRKKQKAIHGAILVLLCFVTAFLLQQGYVLLFSVTATFLLGRLLFVESFTTWKWLASAALLYATFWVTFTWQQLYWLSGSLPSALAPLPGALVFAFCSHCSVLPFLIRKNAVYAAFDGCSWDPGGEAELLAAEAKELYRKIIVQLHEQQTEPRVKEELEKFTGETILLCQRMQQICHELEAIDLVTLSRQISELEEKVETTDDRAARRQYEQALLSKRKQKDQREGLRIQAERLRSQGINYVSTLENMRFAYTNRRFSSASNENTGIDFFLHMTQAHADNVYETTEGFLKL